MSRFYTYMDFVCFDGGDLLTATCSQNLFAVLGFTFHSHFDVIGCFDRLGVVSVDESALQSHKFTSF